MNDIADMRKFALNISLDAYTLALAHFYVNNYWSNVGLFMGIFSTSASVLAGASILSNIQSYDLITGLLAVFASITIALATFLNPSKQSAEHYSAATSYLKLYHDTQFFYQVDSKRGNADPEELIRTLIKIKDSYNEQDQRSPRTPERAYKKGRRDGKEHFKIRGQEVTVQAEA